ncbi:MAG: M48 family metalloprotease [Candidatus Tectomicrobia bacterium]|uniref:M48 family metalloprotease n=1 Tax=Tectimicrobiota bacterium TaxID=2528274 RepID=A0A932GQ76_UNCTE|nr:M48 family metalloprotease [Candidatus Tectomicrobia bacterium]
MDIGKRFGAALLASFAVALAACGTAVPKGAYRADASSPQHQRLAQSLYRAGMAAGENPRAFKMGMIRSHEINAANAGGGVFYFTDGLATQDQETIDGVVAHEVAHEALGHVGKSIVTSVVISTVFAVLDTKLPGLRHADELVNPLVVRAFSRSQELEADQKAVEILRKTGYAEPERTMLQVLTLLRNRYGRTGGGLFATHPNIEDRIAEIAKLQPRADPLPAVVRVQPQPKPIDLPPGGRVVILTSSGLSYSGTLEQVDRGAYLIRTAEGTVTVAHTDVVELRHYRQPAPEQRDRLRVLPLMRLQRMNGWEVAGWVNERDDEMFEVVLQHDESTLFIRKTTVGSVVHEGTPR